jgi:hypothetical protein
MRYRAPIIIILIVAVFGASLLYFFLSEQDPVEQDPTDTEVVNQFLTIASQKNGPASYSLFSDSFKAETSSSEWQAELDDAENPYPSACNKQKVLNSSSVKEGQKKIACSYKEKNRPLIMTFVIREVSGNYFIDDIYGRP